MNQNMEQIYEQLLTTLDLKDLPKEEQEEIVSELGKSILEEILASSLEKLSVEDREKMLALDTNNDTTAMYVFLKSHISNFDNFAKEKAGGVVADFLKTFSE